MLLTTQSMVDNVKCVRGQQGQCLNKKSVPAALSTHMLPDSEVEEPEDGSVLLVAKVSPAPQLVSGVLRVMVMEVMEAQ